MNKKLHHLIVILLIQVFLLNLNLFASEVQSDKFLLENKLSLNKQGEYIVEISLVNQSQKDIKIYVGDLPWARNFLFIESIVIGKSKAPLFIPFISYALDYVTIAPKEKLTGELNLSNSLSDDDEAMLKFKDFMVLWRYKLTMIDGKSLGERSGVIQSK